MLCHCNKKLKEVDGKPNLYRCSCGCSFRLVIAKKSEQCSRKEHEERNKLIKGKKK